MRQLLAIAIICLPFSLFAQNSIVQEGEFGIGIGAGHYFGDLNTRAKLNRPKPAAGIFFRKNFGNYIAMRIAGNFTQLGYSDIYNTHNEYMRRRNLSFNTNVWELGLQGDFNFYRFLPGEPDFRFTPYVTFGVSAFNYDPYAYLNGDKYFLRQLGTEGQAIDSLHRKPYSSMAIAFPFGVGIKYSINERINIGFEVVYRFTNTDYLDDVSRTYVDPALFPANPDGSPSAAYLLSDRSYETGERIGIKGRQRGNSQNKDAFATALFYISFNLQSYKCPSAF
ncbi:MAG: outer membrane beta-barrel protein [Flavisolibacter sp.]|nr:outer membrane beta-barrel protein [Flavisolibacter sp.]